MNLFQTLQINRPCLLLKQISYFAMSGISSWHHLHLRSTLFVKNVSSSTSKKNPVFTSIRHYVCTRIYDTTLPLMLFPNYVRSSQPVSIEKGGGWFPLLRFDETQIFLKMISWGKFYVTERFCDFLKRLNLLIKLQLWLTFLWTTFCPCF